MADPGHPHTGQPIWPLWLSAGSRRCSSGRLAGGQGPGRAHMASRRAEDSQKQKARGRLWLNDRSCVRLRPEHVNHVWSYDFVSAKTHDGRTARMLNLIDEHTQECLLIRVERRWTSAKSHRSTGRCHGAQRSSGTPSFRQWTGVRRQGSAAVAGCNTGAQTLYIEPGSPWENGYCESFNSKLRDEFLNGEIFHSMKELRVLAERWRVHYNTVRPHSSLGYRHQRQKLGRQK